MERQAFALRLAKASSADKEFAASLVHDRLYDHFRYFVKLNCSADHQVRPEDPVLLFPDDVEKYGACIGPITADEVVSLLWRDHHVPEWIDISVWGVRHRTTYFELLCCGRFNADDSQLYYHRADSDEENVAPFGIKSPPIPWMFQRLQEAGRAKSKKYWLAEACPNFPLMPIAARVKRRLGWLFLSLLLQRRIPY
jgi:hypothetical protein